MMPASVDTQISPSSATIAPGGPVLLLATQVFSSHGGVQSYMRRLLEVCHTYTQRSYGCVALSATERAPEYLSRCRMFASGSKAGYTAAAIQAAARIRPALVIAGHLGVAPVATLLTESGLARSSAVVLHGIEAWRRITWTDRFAARRADAVIATTRFTANEFTRFNGVDPAKTVVVPLALRHSNLPAPRTATASDRVRILTVGRLVSSDEYKGIDTLIHAMRLLRPHHARLQLDIVGQGDDSDRLLQIARQEGVCDMVRFHGAVSDEVLEELYSACDIFALPSRAEGFGIVFLEAMRHAKPCVGGNHGGTPEVIDHQATGLLVEHGDVAALASAIHQLADSPALRSAWGLAGQKKVAANYLFQAFESNWHQAMDAITKAR